MREGIRTHIPDSEKMNALRTPANTDSQPKPTGKERSIEDTAPQVMIEELDADLLTELPPELPLDALIQVPDDTEIAANTNIESTTNHAAVPESKQQVTYADTVALPSVPTSESISSLPDILSKEEIEDILSVETPEQIQEAEAMRRIKERSPAFAETLAMDQVTTIQKETAAGISEVRADIAAIETPDPIEDIQTPEASIPVATVTPKRAVFERFTTALPFTKKGRERRGLKALKEMAHPIEMNTIIEKNLASQAIILTALEQNSYVLDKNLLERWSNDAVVVDAVKRIIQKQPRMYENLGTEFKKRSEVKEIYVADVVRQIKELATTKNSNTSEELTHFLDTNPDNKDIFLTALTYLPWKISKEKIVPWQQDEEVLQRLEKNLNISSELRKRLPASLRNLPRFSEQPQKNLLPTVPNQTAPERQSNAQNTPVRPIDVKDNVVAFAPEQKESKTPTQLIIEQINGKSEADQIVALQSLITPEILDSQKFIYEALTEIIGDQTELQTLKAAVISSEDQGGQAMLMKQYEMLRLKKANALQARVESYQTSNSKPTVRLAA